MDLQNLLQKFFAACVNILCTEFTMELYIELNCQSLKKEKMVGMVEIMEHACVSALSVGFRPQI